METEICRACEACDSNQNAAGYNSICDTCSNKCWFEVDRSTCSKECLTNIELVERGLLDATRFTLDSHVVSKSSLTPTFMPALYVLTTAKT